MQQGSECLKDSSQELGSCIMRQTPGPSAQPYIPLYVLRVCSDHYPSNQHHQIQALIRFRNELSKA